MKLKQFGLFVLVAAVAFFSACSDDDDNGPADDLAVEIEGRYYGDLSVSLGSDPIESTRFVFIDRTNKNEITLSLKDFSFEGFNVGDINLEKIALNGKIGDVTLKENIQKINIMLNTVSTEATVKTNGTVKGKNLDLELDILATGLTIKVTFKGDIIAETESTLYDMEEWVVETDGFQDPLLYAPGPSGIWGTSNTGAQYLKIFGALLGITIDRLCVTQSEDAKNGKSAAKIETIDSQGRGNLVPKVTTGTLFLGSFSEPADIDVENMLSNTKFGVPFNKRPLKISGYYKYTSGQTFYRLKDGEEKGNPSIETGTKDKCSINAILYDITSDDSYITGVNTYGDSRIVAKAMFSSGDTDAYKQFSVDFNYVAGKAYDASKKYRIAIIASSSAEGDTFSGAPGSVLYVDDLEIISEK